jgi:hypothetical protein
MDKPKAKAKKPPLLKCIVKTTGDFGLLNTTLEEIHYHRPSVTKHTAFVEQRILRGDLKLLAVRLPPEASDRDFRATWEGSKKDETLSVTSFCAMFGQEPNGTKIDGEKLEVQQTLEPPKKRGRKGKPETIETKDA